MVAADSSVAEPRRSRRFFPADDGDVLDADADAGRRCGDDVGAL